MEAFDLERMDEYEALTASIRQRGNIGEVLEADAAKLKYLASRYDIPYDVLNRFARCTTSISAATWARSGRRWCGSISTT